MRPCTGELRETNVGAQPFRWRTTGTGPPLVFVHGLSGSSRWWDTVLPSLAESYECHLLDVPRFGSALRPDETAEWVARWMDAGALEHVGLVGHSVGGAAAARLAALRPELVDALVLVSAVGIPFGRRLNGYVLPLIATLRTTGPRFLTRLALDASRNGPSSLLRGGLYAARADVREEARAIQAPTLLVWGDRDTIVPFAVADEWRRAIPQARLVVLGGAGHVPMAERPVAFIEALREFLDEPGNLLRGDPVRNMRGARDDGQLPIR
jgi:pimeloyl-ACP methyl ester carboxylesterase